MGYDIRVVIVEDEPPVARSIEILLDRFQGPFTLVGVGYNGQQGLDIIKEQKPDLVFTDIRMPVMSGLEMIKHAKDLGIDAKFVILSGYAEFEYAQKAVYLRVTQYLLKPIVPKELYNLLSEYEKSFEKAQQVSQKEYFIRQLMHPGKEFLKNPFLSKSICVLFLYYGPIVNPFYEEFHIGKEAVMQCDTQFVEEVGKKHHVHMFSLKGSHCNELIFVITYPTGAGVSVDLIAKELWEQVQSQETYTNLIISKQINEGTDISKAIEELNLFTLFHIPYGMNKIQSYCDFTATRKLEASDYIAEACKEPAGYLNAEAVSAKISDFIQFWEHEEITQLQLQMDLGHCLNYFFSLRDADTQYSISAYEIIASCNSYSDLQSRLLTEVKALLKIKEEDCSPVSKQMIYQVHDFLENNFTQPLSYKVFYEKFGYNERYVSTLYKAEFGITPGKYISELRLGLAKKLMNEDPYILLKDAAMQAGYPDALYFSRVFKGKEGISPSRYQQNIQEQRNRRKKGAESDD